MQETTTEQSCVFVSSLLLLGYHAFNFQCKLMMVMMAVQKIFAEILKSTGRLQRAYDDST